jgi:hypothetical protein
MLEVDGNGRFLLLILKKYSFTKQVKSRAGIINSSANEALDWP